MKTIVLKFGGSSITKKGFEVIKTQIENYLEKNFKIIIVLSAVSNTTNLLVKFTETYDKKYIKSIVNNHIDFIRELGLPINSIDKLLKDFYLDCKSMNEKNKLYKSYIIGYGEYMSTFIFHLYLDKKYFLADSSEFIVSDSKHDKIFMNCKFYCDSNKLQNFLKTDNVIITQGFVASTKDNKRCVLSRGGSDTTASLIANAVNSSELQIWTDVDGVYDSDPNIINYSKIIKILDYKLAQEMAAMGAKILHPFCIEPCMEKKIPIIIKNTYSQNKYNTKICNSDENFFSIMRQGDNTVFNISSLSMWNAHGFVSEIFNVFTKYKININIITTSQFEINATTNDYIEQSLMENILGELKINYHVNVFKGCDMISIIGKNILSSNQIQKIFSNYISKLDEKSILITHFSSNKMCLSFVVENSYSVKMYQNLYNLLFRTKKTKLSSPNCNWYKTHAQTIKNLVYENQSCYIYNLKTIKQQCRLMKNTLTNISSFFYAIKANNNIDVLKTIYDSGFNFECVSIDEIVFVRKLFPSAKVFFTPNYCPIDEYLDAFYNKCKVVVDNELLIKENINIFSNREIGLRVDFNLGDGHHKKVTTEGKHSKFGIPLCKLSDVFQFCKSNGITVVGIHTHRGSGINNIQNWINVLDKLKLILQIYTEIQWINIGGGFGLNLMEKDFHHLNNYINKLNLSCDVFIEPGRYLVAESGILASKVTQIHKKDDTTFIGLSTGMNSLIRPTLYNSYHEIDNISNTENDKHMYTIVGPICESGDVFGEKRILNKVKVDNVIVIKTCGAYGYTMSSNYNMRKPAKELIIV